MSPHTPEILPPHPLRPDYDRSLGADDVHALFQRRLEPANYTTRYFTALAARLDKELSRAPDDDQLAYELAFVLLQNRADADAVHRARDLLDRVRTEAMARPGDVAHLRGLVASIISRLDAPVAAQHRIARRVNWSINNRCPMACRGCYNPFAEDQIGLTEARVVVDKLAAHGTSDLVLSGGDPLLWPPIFDVIDHAHQAGLKVALDTTGYTLTPETMARLSGSLASIRLPLDGSTPDIQHAFRRSRDRDLVTRFRRSLQLCDDAGFNAVRVHTVVSRPNLTDLDAIAETIFSHACVRQWLLFQWWGRRASKRLTDELAVPLAEVTAAARRLGERYPDKEIYCASTDKRELVNFFIQSSGQVVTLASGYMEEFIVGHMLHDDMDTLAASPVLDFPAIHSGLPVTIDKPAAQGDTGVTHERTMSPPARPSEERP
ncbi:radical SAM protein [Streptomyces sp. CT34]|uniref:radical SAM protein n=1 Tax=Streptomyces sp. CT34 TaxID=1553907 RepID=UPI0005BDAAB6|nr:radical SAM protein [Streptomyces sp. CT34]